MRTLLLLTCALLLCGCARIAEAINSKPAKWRIVHHVGQSTLGWQEYFADDVVFNHGFVYFRQQDGREVYLYGNISVTQEVKP